MSGPKRNPDKLNTIGIVVVGICGAVMVYVTIVALQAFYVSDTSEIQTMADYGGQDATARGRRADELRNITEPGKNAVGEGQQPTYRIPIDHAMKLVVEDIKKDPAHLVPALPRSEKASIEPVFGRPRPAAAAPGAPEAGPAAPGAGATSAEAGGGGGASGAGAGGGGGGAAAPQVPTGAPGQPQPVPSTGGIPAGQPQGNTGGTLPTTNPTGANERRRAPNAQPAPGAQPGRPAPGQTAPGTQTGNQTGGATRPVQPKKP